jgi:hypothetical protein
MNEPTIESILPKPYRGVPYEDLPGGLRHRVDKFVARHLPEPVVLEEPEPPSEETS